MNFDETRYEQIESYVNGTMSENERFSFEKEMAQNTALKEEVEIFGLMETIVVGAHYNELSSKMTADIQKIDNRNKIKKWVLISLAIIIPSVLFWGISKKENNPISTQKETKSESPTKVEHESIAVVTPTELKEKTEKENKFNISKKIEPKSDEKQPEEKIIQQPQIMAIEQKEEKSTTELPYSQKENKSEEIKLISPCETTSIQFVATPSPSCEGEQNGKIEVSEKSISGAKKPYQSQLDNGKIQDILSYFDLEEGKYNYTLIDANGCKSKKEISIKTKSCQETKFVLNPAYGKFLDLNDFKNVRKIEIYNQSGVLIFIEKSPNLNYTWEVKDLNGKSLEAGVYALIIESNDGKIEYGQITVIQ